MEQLKLYRKNMRPLTCHSMRSKILYRGGCKVVQMDCNRNRLPIKRKKTLRNFAIPTFISIFAQ